MKDKIVLGLTILILVVIIAVLGIRDYIQVQSEMNRGPAVYNIRRIELEPDFQKYNIVNEDGQIIAILNLQLEDFQYDLQ